MQVFIGMRDASDWAPRTSGVRADLRLCAVRDGVTLLIDRWRASHAQMAQRVSQPAVQSRHLHQSHIFHMEDMLTA